jgi:hypothetical protein
MNVHIFIFICFIAAVAFYFFALWLWCHFQEIGKEKTELKPMGTKTTGHHYYKTFNGWINNVYKERISL